MEVPAVVADVHPGQRDLSIAFPDERLHLLDHRRGLLASAPAARGGNDAEGTAVLATVLDLDEGARSTGDSSHGHRRNLAGLRDRSHPYVGLVPLLEQSN